MANQLCEDQFPALSRKVVTPEVGSTKRDQNAQQSITTTVWDLMV